MDRNRLNLVAAVMSSIASMAALFGVLTSRSRDRGALLSSLLGTIGTIAWAAAAYQDLLAARNDRTEIVNA
jgi:hypothetical protein